MLASSALPCRPTDALEGREDGALSELPGGLRPCGIGFCPFGGLDGSDRLVSAGDGFFVALCILWSLLGDCVYVHVLLAEFLVPTQNLRFNPSNLKFCLEKLTPSLV